MNNKFIYFLSLSNFEVKDWLIFKQIPQFYPEYPYFLISAGHNYKDYNLRQKLNLQHDTLVIGDSGGYQISTNQLKWDNNLTKQIFNWLEHNCDIAINLDIPLKDTSDFNINLNKSLINFEYFNNNQTGKIKYLNVLHVRNEEEYNICFTCKK